MTEMSTVTPAPTFVSDVPQGEPTTTTPYFFCEGDGWWYSGSDPAVCAEQPVSPPQPAPTLADTGFGTGPLLLVALALLVAGGVTAWRAHRLNAGESS